MENSRKSKHLSLYEAEDIETVLFVKPTVLNRASKTTSSSVSTKRNTIMLSPSKKLTKFFDQSSKGRKTTDQIKTREEMKKIQSKQNFISKLKLSRNRNTAEQFQYKSALQSLRNSHSSILIHKDNFSNILENSDRNLLIKSNAALCGSFKRVKSQKTYEKRRLSETEESCEFVSHIESKIQRLKRQVDILRKSHRQKNLRESQTHFKRSSICTKASQLNLLSLSAENWNKNKVLKTSNTINRKCDSKMKGSAGVEHKNMGKIIDQKFGRKLFLQKKQQRNGSDQNKLRLTHKSRYCCREQQHSEKNFQEESILVGNIERNKKEPAHFSENQKLQDMDMHLSDGKQMNFTFGSMALMDFSQLKLKSQSKNLKIQNSPIKISTCKVSNQF